MFARQVGMKLRPDSVTRFAHVIAPEVLPLTKKHFIAVETRSGKEFDGSD
jgi:hypothetical protein